MRREILQILAGISTIAALGAVPAHGQRVDSVRPTGDTTRRTADTTRKPDTVRATDSTDDDEPKPTKPNLRALGKVDGGIRLEADLSARTLTVMGPNGALRTFNVAIGTPSYPTPTGTYRIRKIVWNPSWVPPDSKWAKKHTAKGPGEKGNPMKVAKIFFREPDYYIHGTAEVNSLGKAASHGCLRMHPDEVAELAQFLMENGGQAREEGWFSRIIHLRWKTHTVNLSQPVTITVSK
ncbi:MAG TPA: L,D-transpeptidase [Gemmatimonadaceae bacterium]|nr:L,D-transpeptidase [Gemmatimonadaceae bacterium]